jgi:hypothetical protein
VTRKIPPDAFEFYLSLGVERSYRAVAEKFGVSKQAVTKCAAREKWQHRLDEIDAKARAQSEKKATETMAAVRERHLAASRVILGKGLEALRNMSLETAMEAVKAIDLAMKQERLILGEPTERQETSQSGNRDAINARAELMRLVERHRAALEKDVRTSERPQKKTERRPRLVVVRRKVGSG